MAASITLSKTNDSGGRRALLRAIISYDGDDRDWREMKRLGHL